MIAVSQDGHRSTSAWSGVSSLPITPHGLVADLPAVSSSARVCRPSLWFNSEPLNCGFPQQINAIGADAPHERILVPRVAQFQPDVFDSHDLGASGLPAASQRPERVPVAD